MNPRDEHGTVVLWMLGLAASMLLVGVLSVDMWQVLAERKRLLGIADASAYAAASAFDEQAYRADGTVRLDPPRAHQWATGEATNYVDFDDVKIAIGGGREWVEVTIVGRVDGILLPLLGSDSLEIRVSSRATPKLR